MALTWLKTASVKLFKTEREDKFFKEDTEMNIAFLVIFN